MSQKSAADQIWEDYGSGELMKILKRNLLRGLGPDNAPHVIMSINIMSEEYESACEILAGKQYFQFMFEETTSDETKCIVGLKFTVLKAF